MALKLFLYLSVIKICCGSYIRASDATTETCPNEDCTIHCGPNTCSADTLLCPTGSGNSCTALCYGDSACNGATIKCPPNAKCSILCNGDYGCNNVEINCPTTGDCDIDLYCDNSPIDNCEGMTITGGNGNIDYACNSGLNTDGGCPSIAGYDNSHSGSNTGSKYLGKVCDTKSDCSSDRIISMAPNCASGKCYCNNEGNCCELFACGGNTCRRCYGSPAFTYEEIEEDGTKKLSSGAYAAIFCAIGAVVILCIVGLVCFRKRNRSKMMMEEIADEEEDEDEMAVEIETECITNTN